MCHSLCKLLTNLPEYSILYQELSSFLRFSSPLVTPASSSLLPSAQTEEPDSGAEQPPVRGRRAGGGRRHSPPPRQRPRRARQQPPAAALRRPTAPGRWTHRCVLIFFVIGFSGVSHRFHTHLHVLFLPARSGVRTIVSFFLSPTSFADCPPSFFLPPHLPSLPPSCCSGAPVGPQGLQGRQRRGRPARQPRHTHRPPWYVPVVFLFG